MQNLAVRSRAGRRVLHHLPPVGGVSFRSLLAGSRSWGTRGQGSGVRGQGSGVRKGRSTKLSSFVLSTLSFSSLPTTWWIVWKQLLNFFHGTLGNFPPLSCCLPTMSNFFQNLTHPGVGGNNGWIVSMVAPHWGCRRSGFGIWDLGLGIGDWLNLLSMSHHSRLKSHASPTHHHSHYTKCPLTSQ